MVDIKNERYSPGEQDRDSWEPRATGEHDHDRNRDGNRSRPDVWGPTRRSRHQDPYLRALSPDAVPEGFRNRLGFIKDGTRVYISNLADSISQEDIGTLFSDVGPLQSYSIYYGITGRPTGIGEVVFFEHSDAMAAKRRYHNVAFDGRPMLIEVGESVRPPHLSGYSGYEEENEPSYYGSRPQDPQFRTTLRGFQHGVDPRRDMMLLAWPGLDGILIGSELNKLLHYIVQIYF